MSADAPERVHRARRREQAARAAARAGGVLSLAVALLGSPGLGHHQPVQVSHHTAAPRPGDKSAEKSVT